MFNYELDGKEAARIVFRKVRRFTSLRYSFACFLRFHSPFTLGFVHWIISSRLFAVRLEILIGFIVRLNNISSSPLTLLNKLFKRLQ